MSRFRVGSVPYANAMPLVAAFELDPNSPVEVVYDVPSRLPAMLEGGQAEVILVSSVDGLLSPGRSFVPGVCVGSDGPVESVRLFSKVEPSAIRTLALDASSMTSNRLAQIILRERYDVRPVTREFPPVQAEMLADCDACVLIGDIGMMAPADGLWVLDLGAEWKELTGLPFVWAAWIGGPTVSSELAQLLAEAGSFLEHHPDELMAFARARLDWPEATLRHYFFEVMRYPLDARAQEGLREFGRRMKAGGF